MQKALKLERAEKKCTDKKLLHEFRSAVGSLMHYAVVSRPEIAFAAVKLARLQLYCTDEHLQVAKGVVRYLAGTKNYTLRNDCAGDIYESVVCAVDSDWAEGELQEPPAFPCTEAIYGGSRCEARGKTYAGYSDGSYGAAAARWLKDWGVVERGEYEGLDLSAYSSKRAKEWGAYGCGGKGEEELDEVAKEHPATSVALVETFEEAGAAIESGFPVAVCSGVGFSKTRDLDGFCRPQGSWSHAMCFIAVRYGDRPGLLCLNSWGPNWVDGAKWPEDMPEGSFWVDKEVVDKMLGRWKDSFAVGGIGGFHWRDLHHGKWLGAQDEF